MRDLNKIAPRLVWRSPPPPHYSLVTLGNLGIFAKFWKSSEHHRQGSYFFRQSGNMDTTLSSTRLGKSWELDNKEVKHLHVPR